MKIEQTVILLYVSKIHIPRNPDFSEKLERFFIRNSLGYLARLVEFSDTCCENIDKV